ncbi:MAG: BON domain-containing protein [Candidatus Binataceae bacterium]
MKTSGRLWVPLIVPALLLMFAGFGFAQTASESMHEAGHSAKEAGVSAGHAVKHAYHGTATALSDTAITGKVKTALHNDKLTRTGDIHVTTVKGVVTLRGHVPSSAVSARARKVTEQTSGVKGVDNDLHVESGS